MSHKLKQNILCIAADKLFSTDLPKWNGLMTDNLDTYYSLLLSHSEFKMRGPLEENSYYKQIIPQVVLRYNKQGKSLYFLHKQINITDKRLNSLCPLPLGGHIEEFDLQHTSADMIQAALERELMEEAHIQSNIIEKRFVGLLYLEDENPVNHMHIGLVYIFDLDGDKVQIREAGLENIGFVDQEYLLQHKEELTYWSRVLLEHLE